MAAQSGLNIIIDSATRIYDFNLKTYLQQLGMWSDTNPIVINSLTVTSQTTITTTKRNYDTPTDWCTMAAGDVVPDFVGFKKTKVLVPAGTIGSGSPAFYRTHLTQDVNRFAFTTGTGWPVGSVIKRMNIAGTIFGEGGKGDDGGAYEPYSAAGYSTVVSSGIQPSGAYDANYNFLGWTSAAAIAPRAAQGHGDNALEITIPVLALDVAGLVMGGGAGAGVITPIRAIAGVSRPVGRPDESLWVAHFPVNAQQGRQNQFNHLSDPFYTPSEGRWYSGGLRGYYLALNGAGGGAGEGRGGTAAPLPATVAGSFTLYTQVQQGGNGALLLPGASPTTNPRSEFADPKAGTYYWGEYLTAPAAGAPGQDATHAAVRIGSDYLVVSTQTSVTDSVGTVYNFAGTRTYKGGLGIRGNANIAAVTGADNIKGVRE